jgi:hypothetical protein
MELWLSRRRESARFFFPSLFLRQVPVKHVGKVAPDHGDRQRQHQHAEAHHEPRENLIPIKGSVSRVWANSVPGFG